jgi:hypothetical protein
MVHSTLCEASVDQSRKPPNARITSRVRSLPRLVKDHSSGTRGPAWLFCSQRRRLGAYGKGL